MVDRALRRNRQCRSCPWRIGTDPGTDIPDGYDRELHKSLRDCNGDTGRMMACHKSPVGDEFACVGWLHHELGPGNNIALRLRAMNADLGPLELQGEQHETFEETLG